MSQSCRKHLRVGPYLHWKAQVFLLAQMFTSKQSNEIDNLVHTASMGISASKFITLKSWQAKLREYPMSEVNHSARHNDRLELSLLSLKVSLYRSLGLMRLTAEGDGLLRVFPSQRNLSSHSTSGGTNESYTMFSYFWFNIQVFGKTFWPIHTWHLDFIITSLGGKQTMIFWIIL